MRRASQGAGRRNKGSSGEREAAGKLQDLLGIRFERVLTQARDGGSDLAAVGYPAWPCACEVKRRASPVDASEWRRWHAQATAASRPDRHPVVLYRWDRQAWRASVPMALIAEAVGGDDTVPGWFDCSLETFAMLAREVMARRAETGEPMHAEGVSQDVPA